MSGERVVVNRSPGWVADLVSGLAAFVAAAGFGSAFLLWLILSSFSGGDPEPASFASSATAWFIAAGIVCTAVFSSACGLLVSTALRKCPLQGGVKARNEAAFVIGATCAGWLAGLWYSALGASRHYAALAGQFVNVAVDTVFFRDGLRAGLLFAALGCAVSAATLALFGLRRTRSRSEGRDASGVLPASEVPAVAAARLGDVVSPASDIAATSLVKS